MVAKYGNIGNDYSNNSSFGIKCLKAFINYYIQVLGLICLVIVTLTIVTFIDLNYFNNRRIVPVVINTWAFTDAASKSWSVLNSGGSAIDAIVAGCTVCEQEQCDGTVGYGGSPDENGETALDALIIDGTTMNVGAVGSMKRIKEASKVARHVMENTKHTLLVGKGATQFAKQMGFNETNLSTNYSLDLWKHWKTNCQPNFWINVMPDPEKYCGPYKPNLPNNLKPNSNFVDAKNHDTIGIVAIDHNGNIAAGTSTNGAKFKIPGRVGDSPITGSGAYAMKDIGAAAATGDGDIMMRFLPSFLAVQLLKNGYNPKGAAKSAIDTIVQFYPNFSGAIIVIDRYGHYGAACHGFDKFPYSIANSEQDNVSIKYIECTKP
ncbi:Peptidase T2, asparaginase 2,Nucleophile aminohydrolases, N-terminal [Cinara cedri]|uniref:N(4)-(beta-N-acetylglucosaminyl)-L-asparaginase n=1 Tax=Cinara cedri TaxID=506608 RepID=A0A5E4MT00_9HEMI|nr:Peptidase T2, asparaginase 2,Nucleophile aminohydrolases, N-terminal [Cinara cedri]